MFLENPHLTKTVLDVMYEGVWIIDNNAITTYANPAIASMLGYMPQEMIGSSITQYVAPNQIDSSMLAFERYRSGVAEKVETLIRHKDGHDLWVLVSTTPIMNDNQFMGIVAIVHDMSERYKMENELRASEQKHRALFMAIPDIVLRMDREARYLEVKDPIDFDLNLPGYTFTGKTLYDIHTPKEAERIHHAVIKSLDTQQPTSIEFTALIHKKKHWFEARAVPISHDEIVAVVRDVTNFRLEEARRLEFALEQERLTMLNHFVNDVSHDLRNPLSIISTGAELIGRYLQHGQPERIEQQLHKIQHQIKHLDSQLNTLLSVSHLGHHEDLLKIIPQPIVPITQRLVEEHLPLAELRRQHLLIEYQDDTVKVPIDRLAFERMLRHLIINALNYTPEGGTISILIGAVEDHIILQVSDTGIGMSKYDLSRIFQPFYRVDDARPLNTGGLGLGLSVVDSVVAKHGGSIEVFSELGKGSTFTIRLPKS